jgi:glycosyltransferase 2 family protein
MSPRDAGLSVRADWRTLLRTTIAVAVVWYVLREVSAQWSEIRSSAVALSPSWPGLAAASLSVLAGYAVLIAAWRRLLNLWASPLGLVESARIWFVSSLGKYVPGKVVAIGAMAVLAKEAGASPIAATGSAVIMQLVNLAAGFSLVAAVGAGETFAIYPALRVASWAAVVTTAIGLAFGPQLLQWAAATGARLLRRPVPALPQITRGALLMIFSANVVAWVLYGVGFGLFWAALLGRGGGVTLSALAVYTASYLLGYIVLIAPGGFGVREAALIALLVSLKLATPADAALLAAASRIWLTVLEIIPGLLFLPGTSLRRRSSISTPDGPPV